MPTPDTGFQQPSPNLLSPFDGGATVASSARLPSMQLCPQAYQHACQTMGVAQSMGRVGSALDNAAAEALNSTLKVEYIHRQHFTTRAEARIKIATWIVDFYNTRRTRRLRRTLTQRLRAAHGTAPQP